MALSLLHRIRFARWRHGSAYFFLLTIFQHQSSTPFQYRKSLIHPVPPTAAAQNRARCLLNHDSSNGYHYSSPPTFTCTQLHSAVVIPTGWYKEIFPVIKHTAGFSQPICSRGGISGWFLDGIHLEAFTRLLPHQACCSGSMGFQLIHIAGDYPQFIPSSSSHLVCAPSSGFVGVPYFHTELRRTSSGSPLNSNSSHNSSTGCISARRPCVENTWVLCRNFHATPTARLIFHTGGQTRGRNSRQTLTYMSLSQRTLIHT